jgi:drug/metabolite transporter (DMT)-like permease
MTHSLLFVCSTSILIVAISLVFCKKVKPKTIIGSVIGFAGIAVVAFAPFTDVNGSVAGDFVALGAAFAVLGYLIIGEIIRNKEEAIPLFPYLVLINVVAVTETYLFSVIYDPSSAS